MQIAAINNNNNKPNFGHSFRVSICLKNKDGFDMFVNPATDSKLYKQLNSKIVGWLNEDYNSNLRAVFGIGRKVKKSQPIGTLQRRMINELKTLDTDYAQFQCVRSIYKRNHLGRIATGADVTITENLKGYKNLGLAKADAKWNYGTAHTDYVKALSDAVNGNALDYVDHHNVILRSPANREIMLRTTFKEAGKTPKGEPIYELDTYEFHENVSKPTLPPVNPNFLLFKKSRGLMEEIKKTIQYHVNRITKKRIHFDDIDSILKPKEAGTLERQPAADTVIKSTQKQVTFRTLKPKQLEFDFGD